MRNILAAAALVTAACDGETAQALPEPPPLLTMPAEYAWGDAVAARDERLARHVAGRMESRFGQARERRYVANDAAALQGLQTWYQERLGAGWGPAPLEGVFGPGEAGFGFARGKRALVVAWLDPRPDGRVPVTIFEYGR